MCMYNCINTQQNVWTAPTQLGAVITSEKEKADLERGYKGFYFIFNVHILYNQEHIYVLYNEK